MTLDKSIPKIAAPEIITPAQLEGIFHLDLFDSDPAAWPISSLHQKVEHLQMHSTNLQVKVTSKPISIELILNRSHNHLFSLSKKKKKHIYIHSSSGNSFGSIIIPAQEGSKSVCQYVNLDTPCNNWNLCCWFISQTQTSAENPLKVEGVQLGRWFSNSASPLADCLCYFLPS